MDKLKQLLEDSMSTGTEILPYAGALTPETAYRVSLEVAGARIVDVRTRAEWEWVGRIPQALLIEWNQWPGAVRNPDFAAALFTAVPDKDTPLLFLCRSGARSHAAASLAAELGYRKAFNILEGFEGDKDTDGHRSSVNGWRFKGLPWEQG